MPNSSRYHACTDLHSFTLHIYVLDGPISDYQSSDATLYVRSFQRQKHLEPRDSASIMPADEACRKRSLPVEVQEDTADLQLTLSPTPVMEGKKRRTTALSEQEIMDSSELSISLSLSPPAAASSMQKQQQEKTRRSNESSGSGEAVVLGQSTLDLTMSIRALE